MNLSKADQAILYVLDKGMRVQGDGTVIGILGKPVYGASSRKGYRTVACRTPDGPRHILVHRLHAVQIYGDEVFRCDCIRHLDDNKLNNSLANLALGSHSDNAFDKSPETRIRMARRGGSQSYRKDWDAIEKDFKKGMTSGELREKYGVGRSSLYRRFGSSSPTIVSLAGA